jgi:hypothetical protein
LLREIFPPLFQSCFTMRFDTAHALVPGYHAPAGHENDLGPRPAGNLQRMRCLRNRRSPGEQSKQTENNRRYENFHVLLAPAKLESTRNVVPCLYPQPLPAPGLDVGWARPTEVRGDFVRDSRRAPQALGVGLNALMPGARSARARKHDAAQRRLQKGLDATIGAAHAAPCPRYGRSSENFADSAEIKIARQKVQTHYSR